MSFIIDGTPHQAQFIDIRRHKPGHCVDQWPWILASIIMMHSYNWQLTSYRLQHLHLVTENLAMRQFPEVLHFQAPKNLGNREEWTLYDLEEWQTLFGDVICF